ncbi:DMP19 family protein [Leptospira santarosai]|uniref:DNA mimic protein DMP19 C-terminal domain-containing protein n=1 Tax=Leptospira santarosai serovar Shermani str. LT 821 TaxID=758847 RepID=K8Y5D3_9LEPT|nr:DUF4375 domain-containing protein [Leptospira santarosai]EKS10151.1 PF14300 domain protein [Leptospira santarosai str. JET]EKT88599.1 hypothetical protein LSS_02227 [Leptospira santarosai serovar Shermani str. LT 821]EPG84505.1 PF14300 domain protein [Leptospira santarosai serovar Shermani str. 1342KT]
MNNEEWFENNSGLGITEIVNLESQYRIDSLVCAIEQILLDKEENDEIEINEYELTVLAVEALEREVNNGGYLQFFGNSSQRFIPCILDCLHKIEANKTEEITKKAIHILNIEYKDDPESYIQEIEFRLEDNKIANKLSECDEKYHATMENIAELLFLFIKKHLNQFKVK